MARIRGNHPLPYLSYVRVEAIGEDRYTCAVWRPEGISSSCICSDFLKFQHDEQSSEMTLLWDSTRNPPMPQTKYVLYQIDTMPGDILMDFRVDAQTIPLPLLQTNDSVVRVVEMFSGG